MTSLHSTDGPVCHKSSTTYRLAPECQTGSKHWWHSVPPCISGIAGLLVARGPSHQDVPSLGIVVQPGSPNSDLLDARVRAGHSSRAKSLLPGAGERKFETICINHSASRRLQQLFPRKNCAACQPISLSFFCFCNFVSASE